MATINVDTTIPLEGGYDLIAGSIAMDSSYPTGGESLDPSNIASVQYLIPAPGGTTASGKGYKFEWDGPSQKLVVLQGDNTNAAAAPAVEVPNTTNLAAITALPFIGLVAY